LRTDVRVAAERSRRRSRSFPNRDIRQARNASPFTWALGLLGNWAFWPRPTRRTAELLVTEGALAGASLFPNRSGRAVMVNTLFIADSPVSHARLTALRHHASAIGAVDHGIAHRDIAAAPPRNPRNGSSLCLGAFKFAGSSKRKLDLFESMSRCSAPRPSRTSISRMQEPGCPGSIGCAS
jgi:hypothetical protein